MLHICDDTISAVKSIPSEYLSSGLGCRVQVQQLQLTGRSAPRRFFGFLIKALAANPQSD